MEQETQQLICQVVQNEKQLENCLKLRKLVFVQEQGVPEERETDEFDRVDPTVESSGRRWKVKHFLVLLYDDIVATGRARRTSLFSIKLERIAVLKEVRRRRIGENLLQFMMREIQEEDAVIYLHSQTLVVPFYESLGFSVVGGEFYEENIPHYKMMYRRLPLPSLHARLMHHISLNTSNMERSLSFYALFGFREVKSYVINRLRSTLIESAWVGARLELVEAIDAQVRQNVSGISVPSNESFQLSFDVTWQCICLQDLLEEIAEKANIQYDGQLPIIQPPSQEQWAGFTVETASFQDPNGFVIKLFRRLDIC
eukprot:jgi/Galph1/4770/GphlegSOOS_G3419.1